MESRPGECLNLIWTNPDPGVAKNFVFMYALNSKLKGWWDDVQVIVWGPTAKMLAEDPEMQAEIAKLMENGVHVSACRRCSENYSVTEKLEALGLEVIFMGEPLTKMLKDGEKVLAV